MKLKKLIKEELKKALNENSKLFKEYWWREGALKPEDQVTNDENIKTLLDEFSKYNIKPRLKKVKDNGYYKTYHVEGGIGSFTFVNNEEGVRATIYADYTETGGVFHNRVKTAEEGVKFYLWWLMRVGKMDPPYMIIIPAATTFSTTTYQEDTEIPYIDEDKAYKDFRSNVERGYKPEFYKNGKLLYYTTKDNVIRDAPSSSSLSPDQVKQMRKQMNIDSK